MAALISPTVIHLPVSRSGSDFSGIIAAPKDYFLGPVFAASRQTGPREVTINDRRYLIGGFHPMRRNYRPPALDVRHARAIFCLLSFRDTFSPSRLIRFSFNEFCRRYARSNGGRYARDIAEIVADLLDAYIRVTDLKSNITHEYRLIEHIDIEKRPIRRKDSTVASSGQLEMWFNGCTISEDFFNVINQIVELQHLKLTVFTSIRSPLAQAVYLYIPSRAHHHNQADPFEITLSRLLEQVSYPAPYHKSKRKELFTKHQDENRSILQQLDGLETLSGIFHVALAETADKSDWKLLAWVDKGAKIVPSAPKEDSKVLRAFLKSGRNRDQFKQALSRIIALSDYETELLHNTQIEIFHNQRFFEMAKAIIKPTVFRGILSEAKGNALEGKAARKGPTARLIFRLMEAIAEPQA